MALSASLAVWKHSKAKGNERLVLLALADHVNEERLQAGYPWEAWPSQPTLAAWCHCSRSTVQLALAALTEREEIRDTGARKLRGTIVWELLLPDLTENRSGGDAPSPDLTDSPYDLTDSGDDLTENRASPDRPVGNEPEGTQKEEPEKKPSPSPSGQGGRSLFFDDNDNSNPVPPPAEQEAPKAKELLQRRVERESLQSELAILEGQLPTSRAPERTKGAIATLKRELEEIDA
jgi:helix-turn-helix protein